MSECPVCLGTYEQINKPKILFCGHTLCENCCENPNIKKSMLIVNRNSNTEHSIYYKCAVCRQQSNFCLINYSLLTTIEEKNSKPVITSDNVTELKNKIDTLKKEHVSLKRKLNNEINEDFKKKKLFYEQHLNKRMSDQKAIYQSFEKRLLISKNKLQKDFEKLEKEKKEMEVEMYFRTTHLKQEFDSRLEKEKQEFSKKLEMLKKENNTTDTEVKETDTLKNIGKSNTFYNRRFSNITKSD